jgi:hypothetical protein
MTREFAWVLKRGKSFAFHNDIGGGNIEAQAFQTKKKWKNNTFLILNTSKKSNSFLHF